MKRSIKTLLLCAYAVAATYALLIILGEPATSSTLSALQTAAIKLLAIATLYTLYRTGKALYHANKFPAMFNRYIAKREEELQ